MPPSPCADLIAKAVIYLSQQTAHWDRPHLAAVLRRPAIKAHVAHIEAAALQGDTRACAAACRAYWHAVLAETF